MILMSCVKIAELPEIFHQNCVQFGKQLQKMSDNLKLKLQECENVRRRLVEFLNSERSKSV